MVTEPLDITIIGGGAAGFFAAINSGKTAKEMGLPLRIRILEMGNDFLRKVRISGGGRCNVTHHQYDIKKFTANYPRGNKELISPMHQFQAQDTVHWFAERGIHLVAEADGRMFPDTNSSNTIIDCFLSEAKKYNIDLKLNHQVKSIEKSGKKFNILCSNDSSFHSDRILIATGSTQQSYKLANNLGHSLTELAPSLFSFKIESELLHDLSGISFEKTKAQLVVDNKTFKESGPILITHWGLSGPAILKLSAWSAREMKQSDYKGKLIINWLGLDSIQETTQLILQIKNENIKGQLQNSRPTTLTTRFWNQLLKTIKIQHDKKWADLSNKELDQISKALYQFEFSISGKNRYKDEFVECGGINLKEINLKSMESKICPGLYFGGEVLDIDGVTGGFNFQAAWTAGYIISKNIIQ